MFHFPTISACALVAIILQNGCCLIAQVNAENAAPEEQEYINLKRRYWGDEMSSCLEIYCFKYLNTRYYLKCLTEYCPDAILVLPTRRDLNKDPTYPKFPSAPYFPRDLLSAPSNVLASEGHDFSKGIICRSHSYSAVKYCLENICYVISGDAGSDVMQQPRIDVASTVCKQTECGLREGEALQLCVIERCC